MAARLRKRDEIWLTGIRLFLFQSVFAFTEVEEESQVEKNIERFCAINSKSEAKVWP